MAIIRPSADLRNHYKEISEICKRTNQPVFITVNGREDTALISPDVLEELYQTIELMQQINEGLADVVQGRLIDFDQVKKKLL